MFADGRSSMLPRPFSLDNGLEYQLRCPLVGFWKGVDMDGPTASSLGDTWYVYADGEVKGPYAITDVLSLLQMNLVPDDAQFNCGSGWMNAQKFLVYYGGNPDEIAELELATVEDGHVAGSNSASSSPPAVEPVPAEQPAQPQPAAPEIAAASVPVRDRIVVIGRRKSGKTIYLAELYHQLWKSRDGLCMKALSGRSHKELMNVHETMRRGEWPDATEKEHVLQMEFEVQYKGRTRVLVGLDYAGEVFRDAFVNDDTESPQAKALISHIDRATALVLLIDPSIAISGDADAMVDDDYGIVQAVQRVRDWPGGEEVPIVLLLTKADQNRHLFTTKESTRRFIETHYPALVRTLKTFKIFHVSAVQAVKNSDGRSVPRPDSAPVNALESLKYCLDHLDAAEEREQILAQQEAEQLAMHRMLEHQALAERKSNTRFFIMIGAFITISVCIMVLILVFRS